jgi:hypothetical protein
MRPGQFPGIEGTKHRHTYTGADTASHPPTLLTEDVWTFTAVRKPHVSRPVLTDPSILHGTSLTCYQINSQTQSIT